jgi:predicted tellurium resistance membrane protein TerC
MPETPGTASGHPEVHSITDAAAAHSEDMRERMIKYALAMGIRMICLILIFVVDGWFKLIAVAGAVFLPWIAVVIANGSDKAEVHSESLLDYTPYAELEASEELQSAETGEDVPTVLQGELISDEDDEGREQKAS